MALFRPPLRPLRVLPARDGAHGAFPLYRVGAVERARNVCCALRPLRPFRPSADDDGSLLPADSTLPTGVFQGWGSVLYQSLKQLRVSESEAAWLGFWMTTIGCVCAVVVGAALDRIQGRLRTAAALLMTSAAASYAAFSANAAGLLPLTHADSVRLAYMAGIGGGACFKCGQFGHWAAQCPQGR